VRWRPLPAERPFLAARLASDQTRRCAVSRDGEVACWGAIDPDGHGAAELRLGVGTPLLLEGVGDAVDAGMFYFYLCVAQRTGPGGCFSLSPLAPEAPQFPRPPVEFAQTLYGLCARMRDGTVGCFTGDHKYQPIAGIADATGLSCTEEVCCALTPTGVRCSGHADDRLGIAASVKARPIRAKLPLATGLAISRGMACVRASDGGAHCWGDAAKLSRARGVRRVVAVKGDVCLILDDGTLQCADDRTPPGKDVVDATGTCRVHRDGAVTCHGSNANGELGDGHPLIVLQPVRVGAFSDIVDLRVAQSASCALRKTGTMWCWGGGAPLFESREFGPKGDLAWGQYVAGCRVSPASEIHCLVPEVSGEWSEMQIGTRTGPRPIQTASIDRDGSVCVIDGAGQIACRFGMAYNGIDPRWISIAAPGPVAELRPIATGFCARLVDGRAGCFVDERYQDDPRYLEALPKAKLQLVPGIAGAVQLSAGVSHACVLTAKAEVWCWSVEAPKPRELPALRGASWVAGCDTHACAVLRGEVWCWGENDRGQLGDGTVAESIKRIESPVRAKTSFTTVRVGVGGGSTCALDNQGRVWCWGADRYSTLGQGRPYLSQEPLPVVGLGPSPAPPP
jgi:hypothetical protein